MLVLCLALLAQPSKPVPIVNLKKTEVRVTNRPVGNFSVLGIWRRRGEVDLLIASETQDEGSQKVRFINLRDSKDEYELRPQPPEVDLAVPIDRDGDGSDDGIILVHDRSEPSMTARVFEVTEGRLKFLSNFPKPKSNQYDGFVRLRRPGKSDLICAVVNDPEDGGYGKGVALFSFIKDTFVQTKYFPLGEANWLPREAWPRLEAADVAGDSKEELLVRHHNGESTTSFSVVTIEGLLSKGSWAEFTAQGLFPAKHQKGVYHVPPLCSILTQKGQKLLLMFIQAISVEQQDDKKLLKADQFEVISGTPMRFTLYSVDLGPKTMKAWRHVRGILDGPLSIHAGRFLSPNSWALLDDSLNDEGALSVYETGL